KADGKTVIFITHKLRETMAFSDRVTVLRGGRHVGTVRTADTSPEALAEMMVGRQVMLRVSRPPAKPGETLLELERVSVVDRRGQPRLRHVTLRSEEHTSELQSRENLVCRLLLEKKKKKKRKQTDKDTNNAYH